MQHQIALILAVVSLETEVVGPLFCTARLLRKGDHLIKLERSLHAILSKELVWERETEPEPEHVQRVKVLVEHTMFPRGYEEEEADDVQRPALFAYNVEASSAGP